MTEQNFRPMIFILSEKTSKNRKDEVINFEKHLERRGYRKIKSNYNGEPFLITTRDGYYFYHCEFHHEKNVLNARPSNFNDVKVDEVLNYRYLIGFSFGVIFSILFIGLWWIL